MRRTERLFQIIQVLRAQRHPITGRDLADELEVSLRTLYRDMAELIAQRVPIRGEAGTGYVLEEGYDMPPLMLTADELEAAALGANWVASQGDPSLARAARDLLGKLKEVVPPELVPIVLDEGARKVSFTAPPKQRFEGSVLRIAVRERRKLSLTYEDASGRASTRVIWPLFLAYTEHVRIIAAWCETREDFRHFRTDRVMALSMLDEKYPGRRAHLLAQWHAMQEKSGFRNYGAERS